MIALAARVASCPSCAAAVDERAATSGWMVIALAAAPIVVAALVTLVIVRVVRGRP